MKNSLNLKKIRLQNFATFVNEEILFDKNFNVIIGETGSGKSLIFDALNLIFGSRSDKTFIRANSERAIVEAFFEVQDETILKFLEKQGYPSESNEILIKRIIQKNGKSKSFLNYQQCKIQTLQDFAKQFVDLIGQFENQKLLTPQYQLQIIDSYAQNATVAQKYKNIFLELKELKNQKEELENRKEQFEQRNDYISFQLKQINELNPSSEEELNLIRSKEKHLNFEKHSLTLSQCQSTISDDEKSIQSQFNFLKNQIQKNPELFPEITASEINNLDVQISELSFKLSSINLSDTNSEESLEEVLEKLDQYQKLKRKFGGDIKSVLQAKHEFEEELNSIQNFEENLAVIKQKIHETTKSLSKLAQELHSSREKASKKVQVLITKCLHELNMQGSLFKIKVEKKEDFNLSGFTQLEFLIQTNEGEGIYPLSQIASGGELSRVLLAVRRHITSRELISIFLFDEIDTGIGGETALLIGKLLKNISKNSQVIAISHLPQIAFQASQLVEIAKKSIKDEGKKRTVSSSLIHTQAKAIEEKARLMTPIN